MAYKAHDWECGEVISDTKLNNIESGIQEALECCDSLEPLIIHTVEMTAEEMSEAGITGVEVGRALRTDATVSTIRTAFTQGKSVIWDYTDSSRSMLVPMMGLISIDSVLYAMFFDQTFTAPSGYSYFTYIKQNVI